MRCVGAGSISQWCIHGSRYIQCFLVVLSTCYITITQLHWSLIMNSRILQWLQAIALVVLMSSACYAQLDYNPEPCLPDCFDDDFGPPQVIRLGLPFGCVVDVTYAVRHAVCVDKYDVAILNIETQNTNCNSIPDISILEQVSQLILAQNPMNFPPNAANPGCLENWRVTRQACWNSAPFPNPLTGPNKRLYPCSFSNECCLIHYEVCYNGPGPRSVTKQSVTPGSCGVVTNPNCLFLCAE